MTRLLTIVLAAWSCTLAGCVSAQDGRTNEWQRSYSAFLQRLATIVGRDRIWPIECRFGVLTASNGKGEKIWLIPQHCPIPSGAHAGVGPDLSGGTDIKYFTTLRFDTAQKEGYAPIWKVDPEREKIREAYRAGDIDVVLSLSDAWLKRLPIDADVHLMVAMCYKEKGDLPSMCQHLNVFYGLLGSIASGGDGLSEQTAFKVVSLDEEYTLVQEIGGKVKKQRLIGTFDRLEVERRGGHEEDTRRTNADALFRRVEALGDAGKVA